MERALSWYTNTMGAFALVVLHTLVVLDVEAARLIKRGRASSSLLRLEECSSRRLDGSVDDSLWSDSGEPAGLESLILALVSLDLSRLGLVLGRCRRRLSQGPVRGRE